MTDESVTALLQALGGWEGFEMEAVLTELDPQPEAVGMPAPRLTLQLKACPDHPTHCRADERAHPHQVVRRVGEGKDPAHPLAPR
jgi:hypothetical protein